MGNQSSAPEPPPPPPQQLPPPLPPPCDLECQKQKNLDLLKTAFDQAAETQDQDPTGYEKARIAYYTLLNGPGWLATEKQRIAKEDVKPVLDEYNSKYKSLKSEQQSQSIFTNLANVLKSQESSDLESNAFLKKQLNEEKDKAQILDRLNSLNSMPEQTSYIPMILDIVYVLLMIAIVYVGYTKFSVIKNKFVASPNAMVT